MKAIKFAVVVLSAAFVGGSAVKADDGLSAGVSADFFGKYVWRGQNLVDDWVFQPGVSAAYGGFTASFWGNLDLTDENGSNGEMSEADLTLDYSGQIGDGKIFVLDLAECVRIRTGERGQKAIG